MSCSWTAGTPGGTPAWTPVRLGSTGLSVVPLGLAASYGIPGREVERAFERGINLFYWGALGLPVFPRAAGFGEALGRLARRDRGSVVTVLQSYARRPRAMTRSIENGLRSLGIEYTDILLLGWWNIPPPERLLEAAAEMVHRGRARHLMVSCHHRPSLPAMARDPRIGLLMLRYNAAHPGAERDVFPLLPQPRPGIVAYTSTSWGQLLDRRLVPAEERIPSAADCYRFVLSSPSIDACYAGARSAAELDGALQALDLGPMSGEELEWMRRVGRAVRERTRAMTGRLSVADRLVNLLSGFGLRSSNTRTR